MDDATRDFFGGLKACFRDLEDPRVVGRCDHRLLDIIAIAILAVLCGAEACRTSVVEQKSGVGSRGFLPLPGGIPSHDTFRRVFGSLECNQFSERLFRWTRALHEATGGKLVSIDGPDGRTAIVRQGMGQGDAASGDRLGEREWSDTRASGLRGEVRRDTAIPELLRLLNLKGCTVTIDAMGCQKEIAAQSVSKSALRPGTKGEPVGTSGRYASVLRARPRHGL